MSKRILINPIGLFLKVIAFIFLFSYLFPIKFIFLPISTVRIVQIIGFIYFIFTLLVKKLPNSVLIYFGGAFFLSCIGFYATSIFNQENDFSMIMSRIIYIYLYSVSAYLIVSIIKKISKGNIVFRLIEMIIIATIIYALISFLLFVNPDLFSLYENFIDVGDKLLDKNESILQVRLIGLSNAVQYANAACFYGIVMWAAIFAYKSKQTFLYKYKWIFYFTISLFVVAGIFSGRTFFIILLLTLLYLYLLNDGVGLVKTIMDFAIMFSPVILIATLGITYFLSTNEGAMEWAFELFININDGELRSDSTDVLMVMLQILPDNPYTWLVGDGRFENSDGSFYMHTDSGYLRNLFYWGIFGSIFYYISLFVYYRVLKRNSYIPKLNVYFLLILILTYIYNIKESYQPVSFFVLFLMALVEFPKRKVKSKVKKRVTLPENICYNINETNLLYNNTISLPAQDNKTLS